MSQRQRHGWTRCVAWSFIYALKKSHAAEKIRRSILKIEHWTLVVLGRKDVLQQTIKFDVGRRASGFVLRHILTSCYKKGGVENDTC